MFSYICLHFQKNSSPSAVARVKAAASESGFGIALILDVFALDGLK